nr:hypothetical protein [Moorena sp. SIO4A1]
MEWSQGSRLDESSARASGCTSTRLGISEADGVSATPAPSGASTARPNGTRSLEKKLPERVEQLRQQHPGAEIELWAMDEHRVGLFPCAASPLAPLVGNPNRL